LQLPDGLPERIGTHTREIVDSYFTANRTEPNNYDAAKGIEDYLRTFPLDYGVSDTPPGRDTVDYFLFDSKRGYFDYHASAMVVMLRTMGVPARMGIGFVIDEGDLNRDGDAYIVRDRNTYAWPEVYFPDKGWVTFNPSPDRPEDLTPRVREESLGGDQIDPDLLDYLPVGADPIFDIPGEAFGGADTPSTTTTSDNDYDPRFALAVAAVVAAVSGTVYFGWQRSVSGLPWAEAHWEKLVRMSSLAGHPPKPGQTPVEFARALQRTHRSLRGVSVLAAVYCRSRFAHRDPTPEEKDRIKDLWPDMRGALLGRAVTRFFRRN
jgi:hypothetical protein